MNLEDEGKGLKGKVGRRNENTPCTQGNFAFLAQSLESLKPSHSPGGVDGVRREAAARPPTAQHAYCSPIHNLNFHMSGREGLPGGGETKKKD